MEPQKERQQPQKKGGEAALAGEAAQGDPNNPLMQMVQMLLKAGPVGVDGVVNSQPEKTHNWKKCKKPYRYFYKNI